jgi:hypothetical protein
MIVNKAIPVIKSKFEKLERNFDNLYLDRFDTKYKVIFDNLNYLKGEIRSFLDNSTDSDGIVCNFGKYYVIQNMTNALENWYIILSKRILNNS